MNAYNRSVLLQYLVEALAEGYMTVSQLSAEGKLIGAIVLGGAFFYVYVVAGPWAPR